MSIGNRLRDARVAKRLTQAELAKAIDQDQSTVAHWERGKSRPSPEKIERLAPVLGIREEWLLYGRGDPGHGFRSPDMSEYDAGDTVTIFEVDARAAAGPNGGALEIAVWNEAELVVGKYGFPSKHFSALYGAEAERVKIVEVTGDSMVPDYMPGQKIMVDTEDKSPTPPGVFVLWDGMGVVIKRVELLMHSDPLTIEIKSANPSYRTYERTLEEAHILGRVIGRWSRT